MITAPIKRRRGQRGPGKPKVVKIGALNDAVLLSMLRDGRETILSDGSRMVMEAPPSVLRQALARIRELHRSKDAVDRAKGERMGSALDKLLKRILEEGQQFVSGIGIVRGQPSGAMLGVVGARLRGVKQGIGVEARAPETLEDRFRQNAKRALAKGSESAAAFLGGEPLRFRGPADGDADAEAGDAATGS